MNKLKKVDFNVKQICLTVYKALLLLKHLINGPLSKEQIMNLLNNDDLVRQPVSNENIRVLLNSLKKLGCEISKPDLKHNYKYTLSKNPFSLNLTKEEVNLINKFRKNIIGKNKLEDVLNTNSLINTIRLITGNSEFSENLKNHNILTDIKPDFIEKLKECCDNKSIVLFKYLSGRKLTEFEMETSFIKYEKDKLYIWGYSPKYNDFSYLRVDKIKSLKIIDKTPKNVHKTNLVRYKNFNTDYCLEENEVLVEKNEKELIIDYKIENKFRAIQKFLELGCECKIISPEPFKQEFFQTLKEIKRVYENG